MADDNSIVNHTRLLILTFGPLAVIAAAYVIAFPRAGTAEISSVPVTKPGKSQPDQSIPLDKLQRLCSTAAGGLKRQLPANFQLVVRAPFVLAGDMPTARLVRLHDEIIAPVSRALQMTYFEHKPNQPIKIVVCATEERFHQLARDWDGHHDGAYHGYYQRDKRRILLDLGVGNGSLAHELTHALTQCDCEDLPEWFDEGLAALHEDAAFSVLEKGLVGLPNWRCRITQQAFQSGQLLSFDDFVRPMEFRTGNVEIRYAMARSVCLFLQEQRLLAKFYKELRVRDQRDVSGSGTLCRVLQVDDISEAERRFQQWLQGTLKPGR
jgi:hypothetical protein